MAHKTMVDGTAYDIKGGRTMVDGTVYGLQKGKTMVDGTVREIAFSSNVIPVSITKGISNTDNAYVNFGSGKLCSVGEYEMDRGSNFTAYVKRSGLTAYSTIYLNNQKVAEAASGNKSYTFAPDCKSITVEITSENLYRVHIVRIYTTE